MAIAHIQTAGSDAGSVSSANLSFGSNVTAGSLLTCVSRYASGGLTVTVDDDVNGGTDWTSAGEHIQANDSNGTMTTHYFANTAAGACQVTVNLGTARTLRFVISEFSGVATSSPQDGSKASSEGTGTTLASGALTPAA